jgi:hypothetical protein
MNLRMMLISLDEVQKSVEQIQKIVAEIQHGNADLERRISALETKTVQRDPTMTLPAKKTVVHWQPSDEREF